MDVNSRKLKRIMNQKVIKRKIVAGSLIAVIFCCIAVFMLLSSCSDDDVSSTYTTKYRALFYYNVLSSVELTNAVNSPGQFASVRQRGDELLMQSSVSSTTYSLDAVSAKGFYYGLGGLIIGTSTNINSHDSFELLAYDLACPKCDRTDYRLTLRDDATAKCAHCGITYDMNNYGVILSVPEGINASRGLYRYRVVYDGMMLRVYN